MLAIRWAVPTEEDASDVRCTQSYDQGPLPVRTPPPLPLRRDRPGPSPPAGPSRLVSADPADRRATEPSPVFADEVPLARVLVRYARTGLVTLMVVAVASAFASRHLATLEAIGEARRVATITAGAAVEPTLSRGVLDGDRAAVARLDRVVREQVLQGSLVRVKIWEESGTIVYSDESRLIGERFELAEDELRTLREGGVDAEVSDLAEPENRFEEQATRLLEVYLPVEAEDGTPLLFEAYFRYNGVAEEGRRLWLRFAPLTLGSLFLLGVLQVPQAVSLGRRLRRSQRQREDLLRSAIQATDAERRRVASDLHDGVVQDLAGVTFSLGAAARRAEATGADAVELREAADKVREAVRSLRSLLVEIYPPNLFDEGLDAALTDLMARVEGRGIETDLVIDAPLEQLSPEVVGLLYRAAQEALRNVVSHAEAARVDVSVTRSGDNAVLEVSDDGRGVDMAQVDGREGHLGLKALAGLAATMGATLSVDSTPGRGTTLCLEVPIR
jgi:two-component system NarL family sensor kinase